MTTHFLAIVISRPWLFYARNIEDSLPRSALLFLSPTNRVSNVANTLYILGRDELLHTLTVQLADRIKGPNLSHGFLLVLTDLSRRAKLL